MTRPYADTPVASRDVIQEGALPLIRAGVQDFLHEQHRMILVARDELHERVSR